jgi:hypothetical protein
MVDAPGSAGGVQDPMKILNRQPFSRSASDL